MSDFNLIMLSATVEAGGNVTHRHFDSHPSCFTYPFESMVGTPLSSHIASSWVPYRYSWPEFSTEMSVEDCYQSMYDEEVKTYLRTRYRSKFKDCGMKMDENARLDAFVKWHDQITQLSVLKRTKRSILVEAYFRSTFSAWDNLNRSGQETHHVGYLPWILFETDKIMADFPTAQIVHVVRNPWSGYADTLKRPFPLPLTKYAQLWNLAQSHAMVYARKYAGQFHVIRYEDLVADKRRVMGKLMTDLGLPWSDNVMYPSFNGRDLSASVYPWGTLKTITPESNLATALELSEDQIEAIAIECDPLLASFGYRGPHSGSLT